MPPLLPPACHLCASHRAVVFCPAHAARLCLHCDDALHRNDAGGAAALPPALHFRASLCDACAAAPAVLRCAAGGGGLFALCTACAGRCAHDARRSPSVVPYIGCPHPVELLRHISLEAPLSQEDFHAWLAHKLAHLHHANQAYEGNTTGSETAATGGGCGFDIEKFLADDWSGLHPQQILDTISSALNLFPSSTSWCHEHEQTDTAITGTTSALAQSLTQDHSPAAAMASFVSGSEFQKDAKQQQPPPRSCMLSDRKPSHHHHQQQQQQDPSTVTVSSKREMRNQAILRYNEKKRRKQVQYDHR